MDLPLETTEESSIDEALAGIPTEVVDFMWSDAFNLLLDALSKTLTLSEEQKQMIRGHIEDLLMQTTTMEAVAEALLQAGISEEITAKILYAIDAEFISRAENITEFFSEDPTDVSEEEVIEKSITPPASLDVFESLKGSFTVAKSIAPSVREIPSTITPLIKKEDVPAVAPQPIDPYRETPEINQR